MSFKRSRVLNFAQRNFAILKSRLVTTTLQAINPFSRPPFAEVFGEVRPFELEEQLVLFVRGLWMAKQPNGPDLAMKASQSLVYYCTIKCQPTQSPLCVRSPTEEETVQRCIDVHPAGASLSHDRNMQGSVSWFHERRDKARYSFSFMVIRIWHLMVWQECFVTILGVNLWKPRGPRVIRRCANAVR